MQRNDHSLLLAAHSKMDEHGLVQVDSNEIIVERLRSRDCPGREPAGFRAKAFHGINEARLGRGRESPPNGHG